MIGCFAEAETRAITVDHTELEDARWFSRDEVRAMLEKRHPDKLAAPIPMAIAHHLIKAWTGKAAARNRNERLCQSNSICIYEVDLVNTVTA